MLSRIFRDDVENRQANRRRQIDTLKVFNDNVTEIKENEEYKVDFVAGDVQMCLFINLPSEFPTEKPQIRVHPPVKHIWVSNNTDIDNAPGLLNFTIHSDLGRVVQVIIREFQIRPPVIIPYTSNITEQPSVHLNFACSIPELKSLTKEELQLLNESPDRLEEFVCSLKPCVDFNNLVESRFIDVETIAKDNLSKQGKLENLKRQVGLTTVRLPAGNFLPSSLAGREKETRKRENGEKYKNSPQMANVLQVFRQMEQTKALKASFDAKNKEFEKLCEKFHPQNIQDALRLEAIHSDEESEIIAEKFLNKEMDIEQFLNEFLEKRKISHIRKTKEEKLSNQLKELQKAGY